ncbi:zinc finger CCCH domain-containing protein 3 [Dicentrarchus labrax]|uniref:Zinc finger CCCH domain-containing protein 3 n=1 Tax=Dicentrarchus labrax TaxID=13489 RepID=A0A8C4GPF0_DICLA|nr:zinc finger CCCH domain-containing protein 3 [Dicentrarchus labrax]
MEEREALKRQIELLQNLINRHKSVHGDTPSTRVEQRQQPEAPTSARGHSASVIQPDSSRGRPYAPQSHGSWRETYSLKNKNPQSSVGHPSASTSSSSSVHQSSSHSISHSTSLPSHSRGDEGDGVKTATLPSGLRHQKREGHVKSITGIRGVATEIKNTDTLSKTAAAVSPHGDGKGVSTGATMQHEMLHRQTQELQQSSAESRHVVLPQKKPSRSSEVPSANTSTSLQSSPQAKTKPSPTSKTSTETKRSITATTPAILPTKNTAPPPSALPKASTQPSINPTSHTSRGQVGASFLKKSKFTWVKSQNVGGVEPKQASSISSPTGKAVTSSPTSVSKAGVATGSPPLIPVSKRTPAKKLPRKLSPVTVAPKTSKYKWVSSSAGAQAKISRKSLSPRTLAPPQRALEKGEATRRLRAPSAPSGKIKKGIAGSSSSSSPSSRYRWKAGGQSTSAAATGGATAARRRSAFHWTSEKGNKGVKGGLLASPAVNQRTSLTPSSSPAGFKLRSRMKIIRKSANSGGGSERGTSPSAIKFSPRGRMQSSTRSPIGVRRTPSRELVSFGRHKLRRLPTTFSRTGPAFSSHRSPASSQRVFRSPYNLVTRPGSGTAHPLHYNPALSWRAKRIQTARSFLQSRLRSPHDRHPSSSQHWRRSKHEGMCWIRGSLYRVSANKLSRTVGSNMSINRTGRSFSTSQASSMSPAFNRPFSTRHLASRAVQRSLAIIRHARQKKQPKQYCMYYNRFGKCNRGNSCPYIHDPDKVAVCTRFLRGTCKQADGTCPFSHKVAKEKMPVCSYFLKGICNNSDCPYSHVYVSRKAEVCEDFVKGYCPEGEKCKKKHTLVCPDFSKTGSCPRGARCKLQHRQRAKRSTSSTSTTPAKRARTKEHSKRPCLSVVIPQVSQAAPQTPTEGPLALPSFISLSSSPEEADAPDTLLTETSQVKEKKLQIKPRL